MIALEGILDTVKSFDLEVYERNRKWPFLIRTGNDAVRALEVRDLTLAQGHKDIAKLVGERLRRSCLTVRAIDPLRKVSWRA